MKNDDKINPPLFEINRDLRQLIHNFRFSWLGFLQTTSDMSFATYIDELPHNHEPSPETLLQLLIPLSHLDEHTPESILSTLLHPLTRKLYVHCLNREFITAICSEGVNRTTTVPGRQYLFFTTQDQRISLNPGFIGFLLAEYNSRNRNSTLDWTSLNLWRDINMHHENSMKRQLSHGQLSQLQAAKLVWIKKIGSGGYGNVHLVSTLNSETHYAIKFPISAETDDENALVNEIKITKGLNHPNIVSTSLIGDRPLYAMEYAPYGDLYTFRTNSYNPTMTTRLSFALDCTRALKHLHEKGITHNDLAPPNVLVTQTEQNKYTLKLTDFGRSTLFEDTTSTRPIKYGHAAYASSETARARLINIVLNMTYLEAQQSECCSLGLLFIFIITGQSHNTDTQPMRSNIAHDKPKHTLDMRACGQLPSHYDGKNQPPDLYSLVTRLCKQLPSTRPTLDEAEATLSKLLKTTSSP